MQEAAPSALVAVIGAGPAGLVCIKKLLDEGLDVIAFERAPQLGGLWNYSDDPYVPSVYRSVQMNTPTQVTCFRDLSYTEVADEASVSLSQPQMLQYLEEYASHFELQEHIRFHSDVQAVHKDPAHATRWECVVLDTLAGVTFSFSVDAVVVCTGHHRAPARIDDEALLAQLQAIQGIEYLHSGQYREPTKFEGKCVLVLGMGISGTEIANELSTVAKEVYTTSRRLKKKESDGGSLSPRRRSKSVSSDERMHVKHGIEKVNKHDEVVFSDRSKVRPDVVINCSGYRYDYPFLSPKLLPVYERPARVLLFQHVFHPVYSSLAFIGIPSIAGSLHQVMEVQSEWVAKVLAGRCGLPPRAERLEWTDGLARHISEQGVSYHPLQIEVSTYTQDIKELRCVSPRNSSVDDASSSDSTAADDTEKQAQEQKGSSAGTNGAHSAHTSPTASRATTTTPASAPPQRQRSQSLNKTPSSPSLGRRARSSKKSVGEEGLRSPRARRLMGRLGEVTSRIFSLGAIKWTPEELKARAQFRRQRMFPYMQCCPRSGVASEQGRRPTMEDEHVAIDFHPGIGSTVRCGVWAVYDGHGGKEVSQMAKEWVHTAFLAMLDEELANGAPWQELRVDRLLRRTFKEVDAKIVSALAEEDKQTVGSTAAFCVVLGNVLWVANAGDSEMVLGHYDAESDSLQAVELSKKHKPRDEIEKQRIEMLGGMVFGGRVYGKLSVARGFGDAEFKPPIFQQFVVTADPFVKKVELSPDDRFVILACDGLWDKVTHEEAVEYVGGLLDQGYSVQACAEWLLTEAIDRVSRDNVSVMIVDLQWSLDFGLDASRLGTPSMHRRRSGPRLMKKDDLSISQPMNVSRTPGGYMSPRSAAGFLALLEARDRAQNEKSATADAEDTTAKDGDKE